MIKASAIVGGLQTAIFGMFIFSFGLTYRFNVLGEAVVTFLVWFLLGLIKEMQT